MMFTLRAFILIISTIYFLSRADARSPVRKEKQLVIRGRVIFPGASRTSIEPGAKLTVELQDTSLADAPAKVIATGTGTAKRFPMAFTIRYSASQITHGKSYSLSAKIKNQQNALLYINNVHTPVTTMGANQTKFISVSVISVQQMTIPSKKTQWPELVGRKDVDAVRIIKKETGFTNIQVVLEGSAVTMDYRTDRVRVFVNKTGVVTSAPSIG